MQIHRIHSRTDTQGTLHLTIPSLQANEETDVVVIIEESKKPVERTFDFSKLAGRLIWRGDAVAAQRELRDEW